MSAKNIRIVVVEDDASYADALETALRREFPGAKIERVATEHEFLRRLDSFQREPPRVFVIDVMLRWTDPAPNMPPPPDDVSRDGFFRAGLRCRERLDGHPRTRCVPVVFHTVLEGDLPASSGLPPHVGFSAKGTDGEGLVEEIKRLLKR
jgi:CheY-like chemotaxis protein